MIVLIVAIAAVAICGTAGAATNVDVSRTPGRVIEPTIHVACSTALATDATLFGNYTLSKDVYVIPPTVYAARLANGSQAQYVSYAADIYDITSGQNHLGTFTNWYPASTSIPAALPKLHGTVPLGHYVGVRIHIIWWDPVSATYSGTLDYTATSYKDLDPQPFGVVRTNYC
jgi:hypothetical protein